MLSRYKKSYKKIAMGLLSLASIEKDLTSLQRLMGIYETNPQWQLYLWKEEGNIVGLIGGVQQQDHFAIQHLSVIPSHSKEEISTKMIGNLQCIARFEKTRLASDAEIPVSISQQPQKHLAHSEQAIS